TALTGESVARMSRIAGILGAAKLAVPLVAHLPPHTLRALGWYEAPLIDVTGIGIWAPPACWYEPAALAQERSLGRLAWFIPDMAPYSGALAIEAPPEDQRTLAWQAYRYGCDGIWIEHAAEFATGGHDALIYSGMKYGLADQPVPSIRLKRLRRGLQDYELLKLLARSGKQLLSHRVASRVVREAFTDACREHLLSLRPAGWIREPRTLRLARRVILQELSNTFEPSDAGLAQQASNVAQWQLLLSQVEGLRTEITGVRLVEDEAGLRANVMTRVANTTEHELTGIWSILNPPPGWDLLETEPLSIPADSRRPSTLTLALEGLAYNRDGAYPFDISFDTETLGAFMKRARLSVASVPIMDRPPTIDGRLNDWPIGTSNAAGDFRLCRGRQPTGEALDELQPTLPTRVYFCADRDNIYAAVHCGLMPGERPVWRPDNAIPRDGNIPWGQDVIEVLLSPENVTAGLPSDLYLLQVKPSGLVVTQRGCPTDPPTGRVEPWNAGARVAIGQDRDAWIVELAIPLDSLGSAARENRIWGLNIARLDARRGEYSSWSGARGHCYSPQSLGNVIFQRP
ncbi:MAG: DUF4091 domain-containing protein, partial [Phycisphaerae bacterium]|nr:DUF4091 domain-containing protein [Phycisphaerae bacterium]